MRRWNNRVSYFLFLASLSFAASILRYSSTSSTGVSSFFFNVLGVLFLAVSLQGSKGLFTYGFGFKKGSTRFVSPGGTIVYGTQYEILICGNGTFFLFETVFIAQSNVFELLSVSSLCLLANDSRSVLLSIYSLVIHLKLYFMCPTQFNQYRSLLSTSPLHSSSFF